MPAPKSPNTAAATAAVRRRGQETAAAKLREAGWVVIPPERVAELSRLLFEAREHVEMYADVVEARTGRRADHTRALVAEIDQYRAERGWSPDGFGGEAAPG